MDKEEDHPFLSFPSFSSSSSFLLSSSLVGETAMVFYLVGRGDYTIEQLSMITCH